MKNPLIKRIPRDIKNELGKYMVIFLFIVSTIGIISGHLVASSSMSTTYDKSFEKYNIEDGNFEIYFEATDKQIKKLEAENVRIYQNYYIEEALTSPESTLRVFKNRTEVNTVCLMSGNFPVNANEIAIDRLYAENNKLEVGDTLNINNKSYEITGFIALPDYSALFSSNSDMMFDATKFGVAIATDEGFAGLNQNKIHYNYSWKYTNAPADDIAANHMSEDFLEVLNKTVILTNYTPAFSSSAIHFAGDDIGRDGLMITVLLYIVIIIMAFVIAIMTISTIEKEAVSIGTLRASGYTKGELIRHYLTAPVIVMFIAAVVGNILGYTLFKNFMANMYYNSYSFPTFVTIWNPKAFILTTIVPLIILISINYAVLSVKMNRSPLAFMRKNLGKKNKVKSFRLNTKIPIMIRFRLRIIFQNIPNYITIAIGIVFAVFLLLFGIALPEVLENYKADIQSNLISSYQYVLKLPQESKAEGAEKYAVNTLLTTDEHINQENVSIYGIYPDSKYVDISNCKADNEVLISTAYRDKYLLKEGDVITLKAEFDKTEYTFKVAGFFEYPSITSVFMPMQSFAKTFDVEDSFFNGYFSDEKITDINELYIATVITVDDMTKTSRQLELSMGDLMYLIDAFGVVMFILIIYLLSKIIIEKNSQSISMTKILGYDNKEIAGLYVLSTTIIVVLSLLLSIPLCNALMKWVFRYAFSAFAGWLPYSVSFSILVKIFVIGILSYAVVATLQFVKLRNVPKSDALKNVE